MSSSPSPNDLTRHQLDELDALLQRMLSVPAGGPTLGSTPVTPTVPEMPPLPAAGNWRTDSVAMPSRAPYVASEPVPTLQPAAHRAAPVPSWPTEPTARFTAPPMPTPAPMPVMPAPQPVMPAVMPAPVIEVVPQPAIESRHVPEPMMPAPAPRPGEPPHLFGPPNNETGMPGIYEKEMPRTVRGVDAPDRPVEHVEFAPIPQIQPHLEVDHVAAASEPMPATETMAEPSVPVVFMPLFAVNWLIETFLALFGPMGSLLAHRTMKNVLGVCGLVLLVAAGVWSARGMGWITLPPLPMMR